MRLRLLAGFPALASIRLTCGYAVSAGLRVCAHFDVPAGVLRAVGCRLKHARTWSARPDPSAETLTPWRSKSQSRSSAAAQDYRPCNRFPCCTLGELGLSAQWQAGQGLFVPNDGDQGMWLTWDGDGS